MPARTGTEGLQFGSQNGQQGRVRASAQIFFIFRAHMLLMPHLRQVSFAVHQAAHSTDPAARCEPFC